jgi:hypothetical protein
MNKIGYILSNFPVLSETFVSTEIRAMQRCGHEIQPFAFHHYGGQYQARDNDLKDKTIYLSDHSNKLALQALTVLRPSMFKALQFAFKQTGIPFKSLVGNALKLAYLAKKTQLHPLSRTLLTRCSSNCHCCSTIVRDHSIIRRPRPRYLRLTTRLTIKT